jgi:hypothetical protein
MLVLSPVQNIVSGSSAAIARPTFSRDFAGEKTLNNGTGPAITFTRASNATFFDASGVLQTASNDTPRFDHDPATAGNPSRGLLIEESRTNSIRNSQAGGSTNGVIGSGGVMPTNWFVSGSSASGLSQTVVGTGTVSGFAYIDLRFNGTPTAGNLNIVFDSPATSASAGQTWSQSASIAIVGGTSANISSAALRWDEGSPSYLRTSTATSIETLTSSLTRYSGAATIGVSTTVINSIYLQLVCAAAPIDITLRIAAPQLEQGAFPTSYIPTTAAAATRAADSAVVTPISSFYSQVEGTLFVENTFSAMGSNAFAAAFDNNTGIGGGSGDEMKLWKWGTDDNLYASITDSDNLVAQAGTTTPVTTSTVCKYGLAMAVNNFAASFFGSAAATDTNCAMPTVSHFRIGQAVFLGTGFLNGHIRKLAYWPKRLSNTLLQQLTT